MTVTATSAARAIRVAGSSLLPPVLTRNDEDQQWVLHEPYTYFDAPHQYPIEMPAGFEFDLASVPRVVWPIIAPFELTIVGPLCHDWLYRHGGKVPGRTYTRKEADELFRDVMQEEGIAGWRWRAAYAAVRLFGKGSWRDA